MHSDAALMHTHAVGELHRLPTLNPENTGEINPPWNTLASASGHTSAAAVSSSEPVVRVDVKRAVQSSNLVDGQSIGLLYVLVWIPVVGGIIYAGWTQRIFDSARTGQTELPTVSVIEDLRQGWWLACNLTFGMVTWGAVLSALVLGLLSVSVYGIVAVGRSGWLGASLDVHSSALSGMLTYGSAGVLLWSLTLAFFAWALLSPELMRRCLRGDRLGLLRWRCAARVVRAHFSQYLPLSILLLMTVTVTFLLAFSHPLAALFALPFTIMVSTHGIAQWDAYLERNQVE